MARQSWMTEYHRGFYAGIRYTLLKMLMGLPANEANAAARKGPRHWPTAKYFDKLAGSDKIMKTRVKVG